jgi:hypothetical protein
MPTLTVRSFAEMINLPMYSQYKILNEQKYPKDEANIYKIPYYKSSLEIIKKYYKSDNQKVIITNWLETDTFKLKPESKRINNIRVVNSFSSSPHSKRKLQIVNRYQSLCGFPKKEVELKLHFDIEAIEKDKHIYQFYNFRNTAIDEKIAKDTIYLAYWIIEQNQIKCSINQIEFVDLVGNSIYKVSRQSIKTIETMHNNANVVATLWDSI